MTAEVQIFVEQLADAKQIPIQGLYEHGGEMYTLIQRGPDKFETAKIKIGATNDTMATIDEGLEEGDQVVLNLREHLNLMDLPDVITQDNSDMRDLRQSPAATGLASDGDVGEVGGGRPEAFEGAGGQRPAGRPTDRAGGEQAGRGPRGPGAGGGPGGRTGRSWCRRRSWCRWRTWWRWRPGGGGGRVVEVLAALVTGLM